MGASTITTREFVCDNCGEGDVFPHDGEAGRAGWALLTVNGKEFALCPTHYQQLKDLLMVEGFPIPANPAMMPYPFTQSSVGSPGGQGIISAAINELTRKKGAGRRAVEDDTDW